MGTQLVDLQFYQSLVGSLIYVTNTRFNVYFVVSSVSKFTDALEDAYLQTETTIPKRHNGFCSSHVLIERGGSILICRC
jgi:hypothetical protein